MKEKCIFTLLKYNDNRSTQSKKIV